MLGVGKIPFCLLKDKKIRKGEKKDEPKKTSRTQLTGHPSRNVCRRKTAEKFSVPQLVAKESNSGPWPKFDPQCKILLELLARHHYSAQS